MPSLRAAGRVSLLLAVLALALVLTRAVTSDGEGAPPTSFTVPPDTDPPGPTTPPPEGARLPGEVIPPRVWEAGFSPGISILGRSPRQLARDLDAMAGTGARWLRVDFDWSQVQDAGPGAYDWTRVDRVVRAAHRRGMSILALATYTPAWARPEGTTNKHPPTDPDDFARYVHEAAQRYAPLGVHTWEIWNEPNTSSFWEPLPDPEGYAALLVRAAATIRAVDPAATIVSGGLSPASDRADGSRVRDRTFLARVYEAGAAGAFDAVGLHPYTYPSRPLDPGDWNTFLNAAAVHRVMADHGDGARKIWGTEFGAPTPPGARTVPPEEQAAILREGYAAWTAWPFTGPLLWFAYRNDPASNTDGDFGLVGPDGTRKPAFGAFVDVVALLAARGDGEGR